MSQPRTKTEALKQARALAKKYRDRWVLAHADNVANLEDWDDEQHEKYIDECNVAHALPWEPSK